MKPFSPREVVARAMAILRRASVRQPAPDAGRAPICHGRLSLDVDGWRASWDGREVPLTVTEFSILRTLADMPTKVFSRDAIIDRVHGPGFAMTDRTIDSHVRNLRAKFARIGAADLVETRPGIGYRLGGCTGAEA
ncbi:MAG: winged helix-turn-helix domain-containing protein [Allosphingosinicella sp.]